jgi:hypothetical protein
LDIAAEPDRGIEGKSVLAFKRASIARHGEPFVRQYRRHAGRSERDATDSPQAVARRTQVQKTG